jgi:hypothetical protein
LNFEATGRASRFLRASTSEFLSDGMRLVP